VCVRAFICGYVCTYVCTVFVTKQALLHEQIFMRSLPLHARFNIVLFDRYATLVRLNAHMHAQLHIQHNNVNTHPTHMFTHTHTYTHAHKHTNTHTHTHTHTRTHTYTHSVCKFLFKSSKMYNNDTLKQASAFIRKIKVCISLCVCVCLCVFVCVNSNNLMDYNVIQMNM